MTVTYSLDVASSTFCGFHRLLFRWKGSIWKSIWPELLIWLLAYFLISFSYRFAMSKEQQQVFEELSTFFNTYSEYIPITFLLGFYVSCVFNRWAEVFNNLGWIDSPSLLIQTYVKGTDEMARRTRRNLVRYLVLTQAMVFRDVSTCVKKRFPTMDHLVTAGIMTENELREFDSIKSPHIKYWLPMQWAFSLVRKARDVKMIESDYIYVDLLEKFRQYRIQVLQLTLYDWVPIPLVSYDNTGWPKKMETHI
uniref:Bestrophin homolog n=1 Tax=Bursaphelenchus xylophilus TaxID=6326 RepID=A0A1I7RQ62_BURXY